MLENNFRYKLNENDKEFVVNITIPGFDKEEIHLDVTDTGILTRVEKKEKREHKEKGVYSFSERYASFTRSINLPENADLDNLDAVYKNGMLKVTVPKKRITKNTKEVRIK